MVVGERLLACLDFSSDHTDRVYLLLIIGSIYNAALNIFCKWPDDGSHHESVPLDELH